MRSLETEVLIVGSGAGGAVTAALLAEGGRSVAVVEEGDWVDADAVEPFSLAETVAKYRHGGPAAALGAPTIGYAEGCCVGGSTEVNSALYHRLPAELVDEWRRAYAIEEFTPEALEGYARQVEEQMSVSRIPGTPPVSSALLEQGATKLGWRSTEFARLFRYDDNGRGVKQTMSRTMLPRAIAAGAQVIPQCRVVRLKRQGSRVTGARCIQTVPGGTERLEISADHVFVCGGAIQTPNLLQHSGFRWRIGSGLKLHPTVKIAARFPTAVDHGDVPVHRITEFSPNLTIGGSASRRGQIAMALAESGADYADALDHWENVAVYYAAIRSDVSGRVRALPGHLSPLVTYRLTDGDLSRLARGLIHLGEVLFAAGATELYPSISGAGVARNSEDLLPWWDGLTRKRANLMTVHLTSSVRMGEDRARTGADSFGRVWNTTNLRVNDASLIPDAPGVNPQAGIMAVATRNAQHFLSVN